MPALPPAGRTPAEDHGTECRRTTCLGPRLPGSWPGRWKHTRCSGVAGAEQATAASTNTRGSAGAPWVDSRRRRRPGSRAWIPRPARPFRRAWSSTSRTARSPRPCPHQHSSARYISARAMVALTTEWSRSEAICMIGSSGGVTLVAYLVALTRRRDHAVADHVDVLAGALADVTVVVEQDRLVVVGLDRLDLREHAVEVLTGSLGVRDQRVGADAPPRGDLLARTPLLAPSSPSYATPRSHFLLPIILSRYCYLIR